MMTKYEIVKFIAVTLLLLKGLAAPFMAKKKEKEITNLG